jgi:hypothetical protein
LACFLSNFPSDIQHSARESQVEKMERDVAAAAAELISGTALQSNRCDFLLFFLKILFFIRCRSDDSFFDGDDVAASVRTKNHGCLFFC